MCYKWRPDIGKGQPGKPPRELDWNIWQGPAQEESFLVNAKGEGLFVHYNWHWAWPYGNGDIGNQGIHQLDAARWGLGVGLPYRVTSMGGLLLWDDAKQIFDVSSTSFMFKGKDGTDKMMTLEVRPWMTNDEAGGTSFGVIFYGEKGWMTFPDYGSYKMYEGRENKLVKEAEKRRRSEPLQEFRRVRPQPRRRRHHRAADRRPPVVGPLPLRTHRRARQPRPGDRFGNRTRQERRRSQQDADPGIPRAIHGAQDGLTSRRTRYVSVAPGTAALPFQPYGRPSRIARSPSRQGSVEWNPISMSLAGRLRDLTQSRKSRHCAIVLGSLE